MLKVCMCERNQYLKDAFGAAGQRESNNIRYYNILIYTNTVCLGKTKTLGVLHDLSTEYFGIIKWAKHRGGDLWKRAFEWELKENLEK